MTSSNHHLPAPGFLIEGLFHRRKLMASLFLAVAAATVSWTLLMPRRYESSMKILVKNEREDPVVTPEATSAGNVRHEVGEHQINSEIELLTSRDLLTEVVRRCKLYEYERGAANGGGIAPPSVERAVRRLRRDLVITAVRQANIIQLTYTARNSKLAYAVLHELAELYLAKHLKVHRTSGAHEFFKTESDRYARQLRDSEQRLSAFRRDRNACCIAQQKEAYLRRIGDTEALLVEAGASADEALRRIAEIEQQLPLQEARLVTQSRVVPNQYSVERLNTMLAELQNRRTQLVARYQASELPVKEVEQQISDTRTALEKASRITAVEQATDVNPLRQTLLNELSRAKLNFAGARARRDSLAENAQALRLRLAELESATLEHDGLIRSTKEAENNYLLYSRKQEEARIADSLDQQKIANVAIAEEPIEPHLPSKPDVGLNIALGVLLAVLVSMAGAAGAESLSGTVRSPRQLESATGVRVLATVPLNRKAWIGN